MEKLFPSDSLFELKSSGPEDFTRAQVFAKLQCSDSTLKVQFSVLSKVPANVNPALPFDQAAPGLWNTDVVEIFLRLSHDGPYYEFQVSPLGQFFELEIIRPRVELNSEYKSHGKFEAQSLSSTEGEYSWSASFLIPLQSFPSFTQNEFKIEKLEGGLFAILGTPQQRSYYSAFLPPQRVPDFHKPEFFKKLFPPKN